MALRAHHARRPADHGRIRFAALPRRRGAAPQSLDPPVAQLRGLTAHRLGRQTDGAVGEARGAVIGRRSDPLKSEQGDEPFGARFGADDARLGSRNLAARQCLFDRAAHQHALEGNVEAEQLGDRLADVGIAHGRGIKEAGFEARPRGGHEVHRVGAAEAAMHALALLQASVRDRDRAQYRLIAAGGIGAEVHDDRGPQRAAGAFQVDRAQRQRAGEFSEIVVDEDAADVILREQHREHALGQRAILLRHIDEVGVSVRGDDEIGVCRVGPDQRVAEARQAVFRHQRVLLVGVVNRQGEGLRQIDAEKARRQEAVGDAGEFHLRRGACLAFLRYGREAVVGGDHDVGRIRKPEIGKRIEDLLQIVVGVLDRGERGRAVDAGRDFEMAVAVIVLAAVGIAPTRTRARRASSSP